MRVTRRSLLGGLAVTAAVASGVYLFAPSGVPAAGSSQMSPDDVLAAVERGDVLLVDIRRPDEWARTGVPQGAVPIDMRRPDFPSAVSAARVGDQPVALICARGARSARMTRHLLDAGITPIIDVPEGMLGSFSGPGWLKRELPVTAWNG